MIAVYSYQHSAISRQLIKFLLTFSLFTLLSLLFTTSAFAQTSSSPSSLPAVASAKEGLLTTNYAYSQGPHLASQAIYNFSHAMSCILIGQSPIAPCLEYRMYKDAQGMVKSVPYLSSTNTSNGVLGMSLSMIGEVIGNPPVHSSLFIANLGEQIGIKSANAQVSGSGSGVLAPIFKLWEVSRNISYLAMIVIFIGVGFMVMFRQKLNPQTVVSVQLALPGLVIGLVMITFSYFLAALISDLAFVGTNVVGYYFSLAQGPTATPAGLIDSNGKEQNALSIFAQFTNILGQDDIKKVVDQIWGSLGNPSTMNAQTALRTISTLVAVQILMPFGGLFGGWGQFIAALGGSIPSITAPTETIGISLSFVAALILIYSMFKLLLRLIQNLLSIIFLTIAAPFYFLATSLPGKQGLLPNWFFNMLCNVLAFPAVFGVFYFVAFILGPNNPNTLFPVGKGSGALTGTSTFPLLGGLTSDFLNKLLAFGALVALPSIPDIICRAVGKPSQLGALAAGAIGGAIASGQKYQGQVTQGAGGFAGNVGRLTATPGYYGHEVDGKIVWEKSYDPRLGAQISQVGKIRAGWENRSKTPLIGKFLGGAPKQTVTATDADKGEEPRSGEIA